LSTPCRQKRGKQAHKRSRSGSARTRQEKLRQGQDKQEKSFGNDKTNKRKASARTRQRATPARSFRLASMPLPPASPSRKPSTVCGSLSKTSSTRSSTSVWRRAATCITHHETESQRQQCGPGEPNYVGETPSTGIATATSNKTQGPALVAPSRLVVLYSSHCFWVRTRRGGFRLDALLKPQSNGGPRES